MGYCPLTLNCRGRLLSLARPVVMGILNLTPDSFSDGGRYMARDAALKRTEEMLAQGAHIIDVGGYSSRPGAQEISPQEELDRVGETLAALLAAFPGALFSLDTFRASVAAPLLQDGVHILNDITAGADPDLLALAARYQAPVVLMHMQGTPQTMQQHPEYTDVVAEVYGSLSWALQRARAAGVGDVLLDPGFGFGKTAAHNYALMDALAQFNGLGCPLLIGISRKSMLTKGLGLSQAQALAAASALHYRALCAGVRILRVHDVAEAAAVCQLFAHTSHGAF
ncbi:MAG: dihydropteroate synthase [Bacteroidetes bacterium]|nr:dihydropteroate synthase [Bacteroidota bacterium]